MVVSILKGLFTPLFGGRGAHVPPSVWCHWLQYWCCVIWGHLTVIIFGSCYQWYQNGATPTALAAYRVQPSNFELTNMSVTVVTL